MKGEPEEENSDMGGKESFISKNQTFIRQDNTLILTRGMSEIGAINIRNL